MFLSYKKTYLVEIFLVDLFTTDKYELLRATLNKNLLISSFLREFVTTCRNDLYNRLGKLPQFIIVFFGLHFLFFFRL